jgi:hypothetical protein
MWEDGYCRARTLEYMEDIDGEDPVRRAFSKMSIQLYNYGEGWVLGRSCSTYTHAYKDIYITNMILFNLI